MGTAFSFDAPQWLDSVDSTNRFALSRLDAPSGFVVAAREQTAGKGRRGKQWTSQPGRDLAFSFVWKGSADSRRLASLPMATALGVSEYLSRQGIGSKVKWPNDVLAESKKICGILAEAAVDGQQSRVVVGVGVNVNMDAETAAVIDPPAISMAVATGKLWDIHTVLDTILPFISEKVRKWEESGFSSFRQEWEAGAWGTGESIRLRNTSEWIQGKLSGFGEYGELLLRNHDEALQSIWAAQWWELRKNSDKRQTETPG